jgi:hypothetical protein
VVQQEQEILHLLLPLKEIAGERDYVLFQLVMELAVVEVEHLPLEGLHLLLLEMVEMELHHLFQVHQ